MSKALESNTKDRTTNLVAKLMGLDSLPQPPHVPFFAPDMSHSRHYSPKCGADTPTDSEIHRFREHGRSDVHEIQLQFERASSPSDALPWRWRYEEKDGGTRMALIRQKFLELKCLAMDDKGHQSKEFQDALKVLNSHKDLFMTLLQEQNLMFSEPLLYNGYSVPQSGETKRITLLRPSKLVLDHDKFTALGKSSERQIKRAADIDLANGWNKHLHRVFPTISMEKSDYSPRQATRIVLLKPYPGKVHDFTEVISSAPSPKKLHHNVASPSNVSSPRNTDDPSFSKKLEDHKAREAREVAKEITHQMRASIASLQRDESSISTVISNGSGGDVMGSLNRSKAESSLGSLVNSEVTSQTFRHSLDNVNRYSSSCSSCSRSSNSRESSVCREAKKRLSKRWATMSSREGNQATNLIQRESSTLGEVLVLSELKRPEKCEYEECLNAPGARASTSCINSNLGNDESIEESPRSLLRSKSLPVSAMNYSAGQTVEDSVPEDCKTVNPDKMKASKLSFTGKITSLFFSRSEKSSKQKSGKLHYESGARDTEIPGPPLSGRTRRDDFKNYKISEDGSISVLELPSCSTSPEFDGKLRPDLKSLQAELCLPKAATLGLSEDNQEHPSPISVLDLPLEESDNTILGCSSSISRNERGQILLDLDQSNLIGKSPPIGSIARTLSWDGSYSDRASRYPSSSPFQSRGTEEEEGEWLFLIQSLLSTIGPNNASQLVPNYAGWHSADGHLDPLLRETYVDLRVKEPLHEARRRQLRSNSKLVFDFVNTALVDIASMRSMTVHSSAMFLDSRISDGATVSISADRVWALIKELFPGGDLCNAGDGENDDKAYSLVERLVRKELVGKVWADNLRLVVDSMAKEIEGKLLESLLADLLAE